MKICFILLAIAILASAAPPEKEKKTSGKTNANANPQADATPDKKVPSANNSTKINGTDIDDGDEETFVNRDYCYDSTYSFKCRQTSPSEYELECKIVNVDGDPCFPDLVKMIEVASPLSSISYPINSYEAQQAAYNLNVSASIVTAENIEAISLQAPFEHVPVDAFALLPHLKRITLESLDGVRAMVVDKNAFKNTSAKHLHLVGHDVRHFMAQKVDLHNFNTVTFSDVEIDCYHDSHDHDSSLPSTNVSCERIFDNLKSVETLNLESIYVRGDELDQRVFKPMSDSLKKLTVDVVFKRPLHQNEYYSEFETNTNSTIDSGNLKHRGHFPMETIAYMTKLEDLELYLYEPIIGLSVDNGTVIPLPVSKTLTRLVLSCRYCKDISMKDLGRMLPGLRHLTVAGPLEAPILSDKCLKNLTKLEELVIYDGDLKGIKAGVFRATPLLKHLSIKYAAVTELVNDHLAGLEETLESLLVIGTPIKSINVSNMSHLTALDISQNHLTSIQRDMLPEKAQFSELNISYNPIKHLENRFLAGVEMKDHVIRINGLDIESIDLNAVEGMVKLAILDLTKNMKLNKMTVSDYKKLPSEMNRIIVGRSPLLKLENDKDQLSKMLIERNITLVIEGAVGCSCKMNWMIELQNEHPQLIEIDRSRAICSREGTVVDGKIPDGFWKAPTVASFLKSMKDDKEGVLCKKIQAEKKP